MRKVVAVLAALSFIFCMFLAACSPESAKSSTSGDGWTIASNISVKLPDQVQTAFAKAQSAYSGSNLAPVAYLGSQVVAGTNYMILCSTTEATTDPAPAYKVVIVYADLDGSAKIASMTDFVLADYLEGEGASIANDGKVGGWTIPEFATTLPLANEAKNAFYRASEGYSACTLEPMAYLGNQPVDGGTNYAFLVYSTTATEERVSCIQVITVFADLSGNAEMTNIYTLDLGAFNE